MHPLRKLANPSAWRFVRSWRHATRHAAAHQYCMQVHIHPCLVHSTRESDGLRRTSQAASGARDRAGRAAQRDD